MGINLWPEVMKLLPEENYIFCIDCRKLSILLPSNQVYHNGGESMDTVSLLLAIIGAINWGLVGIFQFDLVAWDFRRTGCWLQPCDLHAGRPGWPVVYFPAVPEESRQQQGRVAFLNPCKKRGGIFPPLFLLISRVQCRRAVALRQRLSRSLCRWQRQ